MVSIEWCQAQAKGLKKVLPNANMADSYLKMAEDSLAVLPGVAKSRIWTATTTYYIFYYSLYALMLKLGFKCEIHTCSLEFMKRFLMKFYNPKDMEMIEQAFTARQDLQYYADRPVDEAVIEENKKYCKDFYIKTKDILAGLTEKQIESIRRSLK